VEKELQQRLAENESIFREVNEKLRASHWPGEEHRPLAFRCECGQLGCNRMIELGAEQYERVRSHPTWFVLAPDHDVPAMETVVESHPGYVVVEKRDEAGRIAEETDPRGWSAGASP
jgi:hypothetical protein